jgi:hypothetical protein
MMNEQKSKAIQLLDLVWSCANAGTPFSWERLNSSMYTALKLAVGSGFAFALDDVAYIRNNYRSYYWIGASYEVIYTEAVIVNNITAIESYEHTYNRKPIRANDCYMGNTSLYSHLSNINRKRSRLCLGMGFRYKNTLAWVTKFLPDDKIVACVYEKRWPGGKPVKVMKLNQQQIKVIQTD